MIIITLRCTSSTYLLSTDPTDLSRGADSAVARYSQLIYHLYHRQLLLSPQFYLFFIIFIFITDLSRGAHSAVARHQNILILPQPANISVIYPSYIRHISIIYPSYIHNFKMVFFRSLRSNVLGTAFTLIREGSV